MPVLKATVSAPTSRRGRVVFIGTGGGVMSPSPPLLFAYMASKWSIEAFCQTFRTEMQARSREIARDRREIAARSPRDARGRPMRGET